MIIIKWILVLILILFLLPFVSIGFTCGFLYRVLEQSFLIGYDCISEIYLKDLNQEISSIEANKNELEQ